MDLFQIAERFPPVACRYLARKNHGNTPMSVRDIAAAAGLTKSYVAKISDRRTWRGIPIDIVVKFSMACGVDLKNPRRANEYIRRAQKVHITRGSVAQKRFFARIFSQRG